MLRGLTALKGQFFASLSGSLQQVFCKLSPCELGNSGRPRSPRADFPDASSLARLGPFLSSPVLKLGVCRLVKSMETVISVCFYQAALKHQGDKITCSSLVCHRRVIPQATVQTAAMSSNLALTIVSSTSAVLHLCERLSTLHGGFQHWAGFSSQ